MVHFFISSMTINILKILGKALMIFLSVHGTSIMTLIIFILGKLRLCLYMNLVATTKRRLGNKAMLKNYFFLFSSLNLITRLSEKSIHAFSLVATNSSRQSADNS